MKHSPLKLFLVLSFVVQVFPMDFASAARRPTTRAEIIPPPHPIKLFAPGKPGAIDYKRFGHFEGIGTKAYRYVIDDKKGLSAAAGEGIFPNQDYIKDPRFRSLLKEKKLEGNQWRFVDTPDPELGFYKWVSVNEDPGVKQFYLAVLLERLGYLEQAIKAFYAVAVHFPKTVSYTYYKTPWYVGPSSLDRVTELLRRHPEVKMELSGARIKIQNRFDNDTRNDEFIVDPGQLISVKKRKDPKPVNLSKLKVLKAIGGPAVQLKQYENKHWELLVDNKPFPIRAITYHIAPVGVSPDRGTWVVHKDWQMLDLNKNGLHDGIDESYIDKNGNGKRDSDEPIVGDGKLLSDLGVNTLRLYHHNYNKELFQKLYDKYGIHVICGDYLGGYAVGSGAKWDVGTDYNDPKQQDLMLASVREMVETNKDQPYILMWLLGNENLYGAANNSPAYPEAFFELVNRAAGLIHQLDPTRPVAIANGDLLRLDVIKEKCPNIDVFGGNVYRGEQGFGTHLFLDVQDMLDRPVLITEYGVSAYAENFTQKQAEDFQAMYIANNWEDLEANMAGHGVGNALGGVLFEYMDEWWKANADLPDGVQKERAEWYATKSAVYKNLQPQNHDEVPQFGFPFLDGWSYEEWYGIISQGNGGDSPYLRVLRTAYGTMREMWKK